jgi:inorganic pyrophosphatase
VPQYLEANVTEDLDQVEVVIEITKGSRNKYEIDPETGVPRLDRVLYSSVHFPADYGFIPGTLADDGDALDVLVMVEEPTFPGCHVLVRPIGVLVMRDEKGRDEKVLGVPWADPRYRGIKDISQLEPHWLEEIRNFFATYKMLEDGKETQVEGWQGPDTAKELIQRYREAHP